MTGLGLSPDATFVCAPQGMTSEVAFVDDRGRQSVLKRCRDPRYIPWLQREHRVLRALAGAPLPIPRVLGYDERGQDGRITEAALLTTRLRGEPLWPVLLRCPSAERRAHLRTLGAQLRELHATAAPNTFRSPRPWIDRMLDHADANLPWADGSSDLLAELRATRPASAPDVLIHGDLALDNVLVDADGAMGFIDWPFGDAGDGRYDIALALGTEPELELDDRDAAAFFEGYGAAPIDPAVLRWFRLLYEFF
jgi:aminoglycoside phosphotransferase (APT) family kinase protein